MGLLKEGGEVSEHLWFVTWGEQTIEIARGVPAPATRWRRLRWRVEGWKWRMIDAADDARWWMAERLRRLAARIEPY